MIVRGRNCLACPTFGEHKESKKKRKGMKERDLYWLSGKESE